MVRDELIYAIMEEIEQFLRANLRIPTEEQTNSSELLFRPSVENICFSVSDLQIPLWGLNLDEIKCSQLTCS